MKKISAYQLLARYKEIVDAGEVGREVGAGVYAATRLEACSCGEGDAIL